MVKRLKKVKDALDTLKTELTTTMVKVMSGDMTAFDKGDHVAMMLGTAGSAVLMSAMPVSAANGDIIENISGVINTYEGRIAVMSTSLAVFMIILGLCWVMISPSPQAAAKPIAWMKKVFIAWIIILAFSGVVALVQDIAGSSTAYKLSN